jgi:hypothetical protein
MKLLRMTRWKWILLGLALIVGALFILAQILVPRFFHEDTSTSWTYQSADYGFHITLPSSHWKKITKRDSHVAFHNRLHSTLVGVDVSPGGVGQFKEFIKKTADYLEKVKGDEVRNLTFSEGRSDNGHPYAYWTMLAKAEGGGEVYLARSIVWCKNELLIIAVRLEGRLTMMSKKGSKAELDFFERAAKVICLSPSATNRRPQHLVD